MCLSSTVRSNTGYKPRWVNPNYDKALTPSAHIYINTHKHIRTYGLAMVVWILNNRFFNRGLAHLVLRLHVHLISQMTQEHVKGLKSSRSKRLPVLLRVLWELAQKRVCWGVGRKWSNQVCKESLLPTEANVILKLAEVNHIEPSTSFFCNLQTLMSLCLVLRQDKGRDPPAAVPAWGHATALLRQIWNSVCPAWNMRYTWTLQQAERLKTNSYAGQGRLPCSQGKRRVFSPFYINYQLGQLPWDSIPNRDAARKSNQLKLLPCETVKFSCLQGKFPSCCRQQPHCDWNFSAFITVDSNNTRSSIPPQSNWYFAIHASPTVFYKTN